MTAENRRYALGVAADLADHLDLDENGIARVFAMCYRLLEPTRRLLAVVLIDGAPYPITQGENMATIPVAATVDNTTITFVVSPEDDHNDPTADQLTWTSDAADGSLGTLTVNDDTHGAVFTLAQPQVEGSLNITVADPSAPNVEDAVFAITIGPGPTSQLQASATVS